jgi:hypothetical protein
MIKKGKMRKRNNGSIGCTKQGLKGMVNDRRNPCSFPLNRIREQSDHECD